jgi:hypothetical protein
MDLEVLDVSNCIPEHLAVYSRVGGLSQSSHLCVQRKLGAEAMLFSEPDVLHLECDSWQGSRSVPSIFQKSATISQRPL